MDGASHRRARRHEATRSEALAIARAIMREAGAGALSLGEIARRMGMRTPSLYTYFAAKSEVCDALFALGWREADEHVRARAALMAPLAPDADFAARVTVLERAFIEWCLEHRELAELMLFRPIPQWEPSAESFEPARKALALAYEEVESAARLGLLRDGANVEELVENLSTIVTGVICRQIANEPGTPFAAGRASRHFEALCVATVREHLR